MANKIPSFEAMDNLLLAKLDAALARHTEDPTPENYQAYRQALKVFTDWTVRGKLPEDSK